MKTQQNLGEQSAVGSIKEQVCNCSRCSVNKIRPSLVPGVLESSIKLSGNFVIVCAFVQRMGESGKKPKESEGKGGVKCHVGTIGPENTGKARRTAGWRISFL